jgi:hypothetical protein
MRNWARRASFDPSAVQQNSGAKLTTRPEPTGSETLINTIGIERVCCFSAMAAGVDSESITSRWSAANSFANNGYRSATPAAKRTSMRRLWSCDHPSRWSSWVKDEEAHQNSCTGREANRLGQRYVAVRRAAIRHPAAVAKRPI